MRRKNATGETPGPAGILRSGDIWLHTQKIHGTHVILFTQGRTPDPGSLQEAACLAASMRSPAEEQNSMGLEDARFSRPLALEGRHR